jgi:hypothetical protein
VRKRIPAILLSGLYVMGALAPLAHAQAPRPIAYKEDNAPGLGALAFRLAGGLVLMATLAFGAAVLAKKYLPGVRGYSADGKSRIQLLESRRITPKLTLFVLEFEGRRLLLAQSGDRVVELGSQGAAESPDSRSCSS